MPVWKFRSPDESAKLLHTDSSDPNLPQRIADLWERTRLLSGWTAARGVYKFRNIEEQNAFRDARTQARVDALRKEHNL